MKQKKKSKNARFYSETFALKTTKNVIYCSQMKFF